MLKFKPAWEDYFWINDVCYTCKKYPYYTLDNAILYVFNVISQECSLVSLPLTFYHIKWMINNESVLVLYNGNHKKGKYIRYALR